MFSRTATTFFCVSVGFALLAAATPNPVVKRWEVPTTAPPTKTVTVTAPGSTATESAGNCNTGPVQCCQSVQSTDSPAASSLLGLLGIVLSGTDVLAGLDCSPISVIGVGSGGSCNASPVCCENNSFGGLISIGCVPVSL